MTTKTIDETKLVCPHCGESERVFQNGTPVLNTDGVQMTPYWCESCNLPWHIFKKNGKVIERGDF